ncbi:atos homolog protein A isoform X2 [Hetaerina americana]|uniref:atos homolog protein A isoform X2 n=1 Tax=Hetaerina americana TaxID=62018 RepID=UPI003A7F39F3
MVFCMCKSEALARDQHHFPNYRGCEEQGEIFLLNFCKRGENLRKHALLLWRSGVPLCIEVLLCPDCPCGAARASSPDVASPPPPAPPATHSIPSPTSSIPSTSTPDLLLLEQWTLTIVHHRTQEGSAPGSKPVPGSSAMVGGARHHSLGLKGLFQAVRSQLHFSQLGAWWSSSGGRSPAHVMYRLSVPTGMLMASSFVRPPSVHHFPSAPLGRGAATLEVSLSSLPRMESVPRLSCPIHMIADAWNGGSVEKKDAGAADTTTACPVREEGQKTRKEESPSKGWSEAVSGSGGRRKLSCQRWGSKSSLPQADKTQDSSLSEPLLGESLLDPPPWERRGPIHGPGHLPPPPASHRNPLPSTTTLFLRDTPLFGKNISSNHMDPGGMGADAWSKNNTCYPSSTRRSSPHLPDEQSNATETVCTSRISRHGLVRRRDLPALNTSLHMKARGQASPPCPSVEFVVDDRMRMPCNRPGKHHCRHAEEEDDEGEDRREQEKVGGDAKGVGGRGAGYRREGRGGSKEREEGCDGTNKKKSPIPLSPMEVGEVLEVLEVLRNRCTLRRRKRNGEEEEDSDRGLSPISASVTKGPIIPRVHNRHVYQLLTEECQNPLKKTLPHVANERSYEKQEQMLGENFCHSETEAQSPEVAACHSSTKHCGAENSSDCQKDEQDKCETDVSSSNVSPVRSGSSSLPCGRPVPSAKDKARFRKSLDSAASMVFHCRTGLPLTSSPAPIRRGTRFDFDSSLNSVSAIRSALFESGERSEEAEEEAEPGSLPETPSPPIVLAPCPITTTERRPPVESFPTVQKAAFSESLSSPLTNGYSCTPRSVRGPRPLLPSGAPSPTSASLLGSFEESVLNGRLEPVSTVQGFTAEIGASGPTGCPNHLFLPVTVFFYTLGDNDKVSTPYLSHINLGRKGYCVPRSGTVQVTLFNPLGTVVKMFVVLYDLADMPPLSQTFLRQRTLYVPANSSKDFSTPGSTEAHKWLRYLIHLRFSSSKSGRIYLHTDIRMIIFRKSDMDTATASSTCEEAYELRSFTHGPTNPKFSPTK